jgi:hypothetical protein
MFSSLAATSLRAFVQLVAEGFSSYFRDQNAQLSDLAFMIDNSGSMPKSATQDFRLKAATCPLRNLNTNTAE